MIKKVFIDTDIILDVALAREPFFGTSKTILALAENSFAIGHVSSNCIANLYYILRKVGGSQNAKMFIARLVEYISVIPVDHQNVIDALQSDFLDFEDALQNYAAIAHQCECIVTRNIEDYKNSKIDVYVPMEFINLYRT